MMKNPTSESIAPEFSAVNYQLPADWLFYTHKAGSVARWHTLEGIEQTVGHHVYGVLCCVLYLTQGEASRELLIASLLHDASELELGDIPYTTKSKFPELKEVLHIIEKRINKRLRVPELNKSDEAILKVADMLELYLTVQSNGHHGLRGVARTALDTLMERAAALTDAQRSRLYNLLRELR